MNLIVPGEKYAVIVIPDALIDEDLPPYGNLGGDLWFSRQPPFHFSRTWVEWIGSVKANVLRKASLFLVSKGPSIKPDVLDDENENYKRRAGSLYWSLILSDFFSCYNPPFSIMGAVRDQDLENVRSVGQFPQPHAISWIVQKPIDHQRLERAAEYSATIPDFQGSNRFDRFGRIMRAFYDGIISHHPPDSLHQFVRCIDGFIYSEIGRSKSQFKSRTELFLGDGFHDLTEELYNIRSAVEHLHDPFSVARAATERERRVALLVRSVQAEALARYCIQRLLKNPFLRNHFETDSAIKNFWKMNQNEQRKLWGDPLNITATNKIIRSDLIHDEDIGLNKNTPSP